MEEGLVSESEINVARALHSLSKEARVLENVTIHHVVETDKIVLIICGRGDTSNIVGKGGVIAKKLSKQLGKHIKIVEKTSDLKNFLQQLLYPTRVIGVNVIYASGSEALKVVIEGNKIPMDLKTFKDIVRTIFGKEIIIGHHEKNSRH
jgi:transcription antitermination factor NusA-like protein